MQPKVSQSHIKNTTIKNQGLVPASSRGKKRFEEREEGWKESKWGHERLQQRRVKNRTDSTKGGQKIFFFTETQKKPCCGW